MSPNSLQIMFIVIFVRSKSDDYFNYKFFRLLLDVFILNLVCGYTRI